MASVKTVAELLLLSCLLHFITSLPVQDKKILTPRTGRDFRTKTAGSSLPHPFLSKSRRVPDSATRFGIKTSSTGIKTKVDVTTQPSIIEVTSVSDLATEESEQQVPISDSATHISPAVSNFGDRLNSKKHETKSRGCNIKGRCTPSRFTPVGGTSVNGAPSITNGIQENHQESINDVHPDQQQQFNGVNGQETNGISVNGVPSATDSHSQTDDSQTGQHTFGPFPDYEGLISLDFPSVKGGPRVTVQEDQSPIDIGGTQIVSEDVPDHTGFDDQTQLVNQEDFSERHDTSHETTVPAQEISPIQPNGPSSPSDSFPHQKVPSGVKGHRNHGKAHPFAPRFPPPSFVPDTESPAVQTQITDQTTSSDFVPDTQGPMIQEEINGHSTAPNLTPDSQTDLTQFEINGQSVLPDFVPETQEHSTQPQVTGQTVSQDFIPDSQVILAQHEINGQSVPTDFTGDFQGHLSQEEINGQPDALLDNGHQNDNSGQYHHFGNPIDWLRQSVPGNPGQDYPIFYTVPQTSFNCKQQQFSAGIFGDMEASCQVFHICKEDGGQDSFLCPNGTVFNQQYFVCDWWYNFNCADTPSFYNLNADLYWDWDSFTPTQVLNGPAIVDDRLSPNFEIGSQNGFINGPGSEDRTPVTDVSDQNNGVKSTIAIDNSAIENKDRLIPEQVPEDHTFSNGQKNQDYDQQVQEEFSPSFDAANGGQQPVTDIDDGHGVQTVFPTSSDTGANTQPGTDAGTRYPDQVGNGHQSTSTFQTQDQETTVNFEDGFGPNIVQEPIVQTFVTQGPDSFDSRDQFEGDSFTSSQNAQDDFGGATAQFDINPEVSSSIDSQNGQNGPVTSVTNTNEFPDQFPINGVGDQMNQVQQEYLHTGFDNTPSTGGQQDFPTPGINGNGDINGNGVSQEEQGIQQELIIDSFNGNNQHIQTVGPSTLQTDNIDSAVNGNGGNINDDVQQNVQQEHVPEFDNGNGPTVNTNEGPATFGPVDNNQGQVIIPFQPNNQEGQSQVFNQEITQDYLPVSFDQQTINPFNGDGNTNVPGLDEGNTFSTVNQDNLNANDYQVTDQQQPNGFNNGVGDSSPYDHTNTNVQQENVVFSFNGNSQNAFNSGNHHDNNNNFNNVPPNNDGPYFQQPQALRQEPAPENFNNYQNHDQNSFNQDNNYRPNHDQIRNDYPVNVVNGGYHQNTNEASGIRSNNFQPTNIHLMNRGQFQNGNFQQERVSFRPYGQNVPNTVKFPESGSLILVANQENGATPNYNNNNGPSNNNFFITNGHQVHDVQLVLQEPNGQRFSNEQPVNTVGFNQNYFHNNQASYDRNQENVQNIRTNQQGPFLENNIANSGVKGNFYRRSLDTTGPVARNMNMRGYPAVSIKSDDVKNYSQPAPESPNSMSNNGWKPVVKH